MKNAWLLLVLVIVAIAAVWFWLGSGGPEVASIDLVEAFDEAEKRTDQPSLQTAFQIEDVTIDGSTKRAIYAHPTSRIIYRLTLPEDAWLRTSMALKPGVWETEGDGVLFRIGVSDGRVYEELLNQLVDPIGMPEDRRWVPVILDLSGYGGSDVEVIFNTNASLPGFQDTRNDWAVWGEPEIFVE